MVKTVLEARHIETRFGSKVVHRDLSLEVREGEVLVVLGGSGSGKSVLLRSFIGLDRPAEGEILFQGENILQFDERRMTPVRRRIAYVFQGGALFDSLTVAENLAYPLKEHFKLDAKETAARVSAILERMGLPGTEKLLPSALSGGMQKRVGLARALMLEPEVILYDEPTAGLDPANSRNISELILDLKNRGQSQGGSTAVLVTHDIDCALRVADRVAFIHNGTVAELESIESAREQRTPLIGAYLRGEPA